MFENESSYEMTLIDVHSGECFYCKRGFSSRCEESLLFGCPKLDGAQAEYVRSSNSISYSTHLC